jgi:hypothetical protein
MARTPSTAVAVLGDAHRPQQDGRVGRGVLVDEGLDLLEGEPRGEQVVERLRVEGGDQLVPPLGVGLDEARSTAPLDEQLERGVGEGDVAPGTHRDVQVAHLGAEQCRLEVRRHPVAVEPWFEVRVDHHHPTPLGGPGTGTS